MASRLNVQRLRAIRAGTPAAVDRGVERGAGYIKDLEQQLAPKDEGDLASTVRVEGQKGSGRRVVRAGGKSGPNKFVDYQHFVEYGTADSPAQPYATPAAKAISVAKEIKVEMKKLVRGR